MLIRTVILIFLLILQNLCYSQANTNIKSSKSNPSVTNLKDNSKSINNHYKTITPKVDLNKSAAIKIKNNDFTGAKIDYEKALVLNPNDEVTHLNYALLLINNFNDLVSAKYHFQSAISINPKFAKAHYLYAVALKIFYKDNVNARKEYVLAAKLKPSYISAEADKLFNIKR
jgi:tetratricopeptide (TPR) repeat protein